MKPKQRFVDANIHFHLFCWFFLYKIVFLPASKWFATTYNTHRTRSFEHFSFCVWFALCILRFVFEENFINIYTKSQRIALVILTLNRNKLRHSWPYNIFYTLP